MYTNFFIIMVTLSKRVTMVPWEHGKCVVWNFTCPDTLAPSNRAVAVSAPGSVAAQAEMRKIAKYSRKFHPIQFYASGN